MEDEEFESIAIWRDRAYVIDDIYVKFFILYMCFDAWMTSESGKDSDEKKKQWIKQDGNLLHQYWKTGRHESIDFLKGLKGLSPVKDLRPGHQNSFEKLTDINNFKQVVDFIYQIRCNLFHGGKSAIDGRDRELVEYSYHVLLEWLNVISTHRNL